MMQKRIQQTDTLITLSFIISYFAIFTICHKCAEITISWLQYSSKSFDKGRKKKTRFSATFFPSKSFPTPWITLINFKRQNFLEFALGNKSLSGKTCPIIEIAEAAGKKGISATNPDRIWSPKRKLKACGQNFDVFVWKLREIPLGKISISYLYCCCTRAC